MPPPAPLADTVRRARVLLTGGDGAPGRKFSRDVTWNLASLFVLGVAGVAINALIATFGGPAMLGVFNQVYAFHIVLSQLAVGGVHVSVLRHTALDAGRPDRLARLTPPALLATLAVAVPVSAAVWAGAGLAGRWMDSPGVAVGLRLAAPGLAVFAVNKTLLMYLNGLRHMRAFASFQALRYLLLLATVAAIMISRWPGDFLPLALTLSEAALLPPLLGFAIRKGFSLRPREESAVWFVRHLGFGSRGFLSGALMEMNTRVDVLMLGYFLPDAPVGLYSFAATLAEGLAQVPHIVRQNMDPILGRCFGDGVAARIPELTRRIRRVFVPAMASLTLAAVCAYPLVFLLFLPGERLAPSWLVFAVLAFGVTANAAYRPFLGILIQGGRPGTHTGLVLAVTFSNVALNAALIPPLGLAGAALATALALGVEALLLARLSRRLFGLRI
jgi:O-antigen/teichoic acid export membrane protein